MENLQSEVKQQLLSRYKFKIEMHAHTLPVSPCSQITPVEMVKTYSNLGYDAIVITNHFIYELLTELPKDEAVLRYIKDFEDTCIAAEKYKINILLGVELRFVQNFNDYLLYGVDRELLYKIFDYLPLGIEKFREELKLPNSVFIQAHPFRDGMERVSPKLLDGIETFNMHPGHNSRIALATKYARENNFKITIAGSDFHHQGMGHEGVAALRTSILPKNSYELAEILKSGDYVTEIGGQAIVLP